MKKFLLVAVMAVAGITMAIAQPRAIGVNLGYGAAFSYQHGFGDKNMIDLSVEAPAFNGVGATCTYDWIDPFNTQIPWSKKGEWHWALGVGAGAGLWSWVAPSFYVGAAGHVGVAYDFWFPLELSIDYRPVVGPNFWDGIHYHIDGLYTGLNIGVRYRFH